MGGGGDGKASEASKNCCPNHSWSGNLGLIHASHGLWNHAQKWLITDPRTECWYCNILTFCMRSSPACFQMRCENPQHSCKASRRFRLHVILTYGPARCRINAAYANFFAENCLFRWGRAAEQFLPADFKTVLGGFASLGIDNALWSSCCRRAVIL